MTMSQLRPRTKLPRLPASTSRRLRARHQRLPARRKERLLSLRYDSAISLGEDKLTIVRVRLLARRKRSRASYDAFPLTNHPR